MNIYVLVETTFFNNGSYIIRTGNSYMSFNDAWGNGVRGSIESKIAAGVADILEETTSSCTIREYTTAGDRTIEYRVCQSYLLV